MADFVLLKAKNGGLIPVNPDQVQYVMNTHLGPALVFGAVPGGLHQVHVEGEVDEIVEALTTRAPLTALATLRVLRDDGCREGEAEGEAKGRARDAVNRATQELRTKVQAHAAKTAPAQAEAVEGKRRGKA